jgi:hypothetical protein
MEDMRKLSRTGRRGVEDERARKGSGEETFKIGDLMQFRD